MRNSVKESKAELRRISSIALFVVLFLLFSFTSLSYAYKLPDTGQTKCYDASGEEISCSGTGQDGEYSINPMSFTDNGNGTVTDNNTGLMWQKCSAGQNNDSSCSGTAVYYTWQNALNYCNSLSLAGYTDWRLPGKKELITIVDYSVPYTGPTINTAYFPNTALSNYWSSTTYAGSTDYAWVVYFYYGGVGYNFKTDGYYVRCARFGQ